jgi:hypothetical protein
MTNYVFAKKPGTELLVGHERLVFPIADLDLAVEFAGWLQARGWVVTMSDSTESHAPRNTALAETVVPFLVQEFMGELARLQRYGRSRLQGRQDVVGVLGGS